jgi:hypothetical protein
LSAYGHLSTTTQISLQKVDAELLGGPKNGCVRRSPNNAGPACGVASPVGQWEARAVVATVQWR